MGERSAMADACKPIYYYLVSVHVVPLLQKY